MKECGVVIQHKLPPKLIDLGIFTTTCSNSPLMISHTLCDLGASNNLMPNPTKMTFNLVDRSITYPYGILEDVLIRVDDLLFSYDFVILDMAEDFETPLMLGRLSLET